MAFRYVRFRPQKFLKFVDIEEIESYKLLKMRIPVQNGTHKRKTQIIGIFLLIFLNNGLHYTITCFY